MNSPPQRTWAMCQLPRPIIGLLKIAKKSLIPKRLKIAQIKKSKRMEEAFIRLVRTIEYSTIKIVSLIIEWLFPKICFGCHKGHKYLCNMCESKLITGSLTVKDSFEGIISIYKYDGLMKEMVEKIKYEFVNDVVEELAQLMAKKLKISYPNIVKYWQREKYCLIPIPLYWQRKNWRGFNQSEMLADNLAKILSLKFEKNILTRNVKTKNQATIKNRQLRRKNISNVFIVNEKKIAPKKVILVDDVVTSGATMTAAWRTLKDSGADLAWGLSLCGVQK